MRKCQSTDFFLQQCFPKPLSIAFKMSVGLLNSDTHTYVLYIHALKYFTLVVCTFFKRLHVHDTKILIRLQNWIENQSKSDS